MLVNMSARIIRFPDRRAALAEVADRSPEARQRQDAVAASFSTAGLSWATESDWLGRAHHVLDHVEDLLDDGDAAEVAVLCERATWCLLQAAPEIDDRAAVMDLLDRVRDLHLRACQASPPDPVHLAEFVYGLAHSEAMGVLHGVIDPYVGLLGPVGLAEIRRRLADDERAHRRSTGIARQIEDFRRQPILASLARAAHPSAV